MRIKHQYYAVNGTLAITCVLYKREMDFIENLDHRLLDVAGGVNIVNALHALILIAERIEQRDEQLRVTQKSAAGAKTGRVRNSEYAPTQARGDL